MTQDNKPSTNQIITADANDLPESTPNVNEGMMRRDWLKNVMIGGVGLGLFGIPMPTFAEDELALAGCPRIIRVSKNIKAEIVQYVCKSCLCDKEQVFMITFDFKGLVFSNKVCDESIKMIPDKSIMNGSLRYTVRRGLCPETKMSALWGCHEGKVALYNPAEAQLFAIPMAGTYGVNPQASATKRCCWPYAEGLLKGKGEKCSICCTYHMTVPLNPVNPCTKTPPNSLYMQFDGSLMCPC